ncbi:four helix bundle protein [Haloferula sp. A504]|uniref:four helix bundle protein n=1 Tax=Haloferula sp. A504 TaxID=3373601 RepID=UPI0031C68117|nr:four helix bundle protein [Verrucomicrobiaceae bacterium E54]
MDEEDPAKPPYDLEERTLEFALDVRRCVGSWAWTRWQWSDIDQLLRSSGSVASNYAEANNSSTKPEFRHRISVCRRESSESRLWVQILGSTTKQAEPKEQLRELFNEADELTRIFATIYRNSKP